MVGPTRPRYLLALPVLTLTNMGQTIRDKYPDRLLRKLSQARKYSELLLPWLDLLARWASKKVAETSLADIRADAGLDIGVSHRVAQQCPPPTVVRLQ